MPIVRCRSAKPHSAALWLLRLLALCLALSSCSLLPSPPASALAPTAPSATQAAALQAQPIDGFSTVASNQLPLQARQTLALIAQGGPFPYRQDGLQNRERRLPRHPNGYYHEYTVETPGSDDRGARRIITGAAGEIFYTDDHYASFVQVLPQ